MNRADMPTPGSSKMETCKYCGKVKPLVKSHIIPRSFYEIEYLREKEPKKSLSMISDSEKFDLLGVLSVFTMKTSFADNVKRSS
jgi:hypothetical protein